MYTFCIKMFIIKLQRFLNSYLNSATDSSKSIIFWRLVTLKYMKKKYLTNLLTFNNLSNYKNWRLHNQKRANQANVTKGRLKENKK